MPRVKFIVTTLGKKGSLLIERADPQEASKEAITEAVLEDLLTSMLKDVASGSSEFGNENGDGINPLGCRAKNGVQIK